MIRYIFLYILDHSIDDGQFLQIPIFVGLGGLGPTRPVGSKDYMILYDKKFGRKKYKFMDEGLSVSKIF